MIFLSCKQKKFCLSLGLGSNFPIIQLFIFLHHHGDSQSQISISVAVLGYVISREITVKRYNILSIQTEILLFLSTSYFQGKPVLGEFNCKLMKLCKKKGRIVKIGNLGKPASALQRTRTLSPVLPPCFPGVHVLKVGVFSLDSCCTKPSGWIMPDQIQPRWQ